MTIIYHGKSTRQIFRDYAFPLSCHIAGATSRARATSFSCFYLSSFSSPASMAEQKHLAAFKSKLNLYLKSAFCSFVLLTRSWGIYVYNPPTDLLSWRNLLILPLEASKASLEKLCVVVALHWFPWHRVTLQTIFHMSIRRWNMRSTIVFCSAQWLYCL